MSLMTCVLTTSFQNVSALTNAERYLSGYNTAKNAGIGIPNYMDIISGYLFQNHSDAYRNGYIAGVDLICGIKLPYMDYSIIKTYDGQGDPIDVTHIVMHQSTAEIK